MRSHNDGSFFGNKTKALRNPCTRLARAGRAKCTAREIPDSGAKWPQGASGIFRQRSERLRRFEQESKAVAALVFGLQIGMNNIFIVCSRKALRHLHRVIHRTTSGEPSLQPNLPTEAGTVLGTAGYMAREQVRGTAVDSRTDISAGRASALYGPGLAVICSLAYY
jgi:serine/threonine protein kinase